MHVDLVDMRLHFNPWRWIELFEEKNLNIAKDMAIIESGRITNIEFFQDMVDRPQFDDDDEVSDDDVTEKDKHLMVEDLTKYYFNCCSKSCNYEHENVKDPIFQSKVKQMMHILHD